jgi:2,4-dienoyl-CoA reductase-like NADH-dependent reductase (Old Yellow Enzyme family)
MRRKLRMLFEKGFINSLELQNRIIRSATWDGMATRDGKCTEAMIQFEKLVTGGVGLIMSGFACVHASGKPFPYSLSVDSDECIDSLSRLTERVHSLGGKIGIQLSHGGSYSRPRLIGKERLKVPSLPEKAKRLELYQVMSLNDIQDMVSAFTMAAIRSKTAGIDLVQIQAGHGYLISQFLSPATNKRTDDYGGVLNNRARIVYEIYENVRNALGNSFPITVKINASDLTANGLIYEESIEIVRELRARKIDAVEVSGGQQEDTVTSPIRTGIVECSDEGYFTHYARCIKSLFNDIPVIAVGGIRSYDNAAEIIRSSTADFVAISRPLICEPGLPKRWYEGDRKKPACVSCNKCFMPGLQGKGIQCMLGASA